MDDEVMRGALVALRETRATFAQLVAAFTELVESPDSGLDSDPVVEFDERWICWEYLGGIQRRLDDLVRMLAAVKGKAALAELVMTSEGEPAPTKLVD